MTPACPGGSTGRSRAPLRLPLDGASLRARATYGLPGQASGGGRPGRALQAGSPGPERHLSSAAFEPCAESHPDQEWPGRWWSIPLTAAPTAVEKLSASGGGYPLWNRLAAYPAARGRVSPTAGRRIVATRVDQFSLSPMDQFSASLDTRDPPPGRFVSRLSAVGYSRLRHP